MSFVLTKRVIETHITNDDQVSLPTAKLVLIVLASHVNTRSKDKMTAFPSVGTLARKTGFSERTIQYALRDLEAFGYVITSFENERSVRHYRLVDERLIPVEELRKHTSSQADHAEEGASVAPGGVQLLHPNKERSAEAVFEVDHTDADRKEHSSIPVEPSYPPDPLDPLFTPDTDPVTGVDAVRLSAVSSPTPAPRLGRGWTAPADTPRYGPQGKRIPE